MKKDCWYTYKGILFDIPCTTCGKVMKENKFSGYHYYDSTAKIGESHIILKLFCNDECKSKWLKQNKSLVFVHEV